MTSLATLRVDIAQVRETMVQGRYGSIRALLAVRGDALLGPNLIDAQIENLDEQARTFTLVLPQPRVIIARLDHSQTHVCAITFTELWFLVPGDAGRTEIINRAYAEAQDSLYLAAGDQAFVVRSREYAEQVIDQVFGALAWKVRVDWSN